jgi:sugar phosphate isomerase/epimerase
MVEIGSGSGFTTGYLSAMDRDSDGNNHSHDGENHHCGHDHGSGGATSDLGIKAGDFGTSFLMGLGSTSSIPGILAQIRTGAKTIELGLGNRPGAKGGQGGHSAGMYGKKQRQALREGAKANRVDFTLHTSVGVAGLAGQGQQGFNRETKEMSIQEIKRALEFAADVGEGGPVVVHTGEYNRAMKNANWNKGDKWKDKFEWYENEEQRGSFQVVDTRTGQIIAEAKKGKSISKPEWKVFEEGDNFWEKKGGRSYKDGNGELVEAGDYIDYWGNKVSRASRVPKWDDEKQEFKIQQLTWDKLEGEARQLTEEARNFWNENRNSSEKIWNDSIWKRFKDVKRENEIQVLEEEAYIISSLETNAANSRAWALNYMQGFDEHIKDLEKLKKTKEIYEKIELETNEDDKWQLLKDVPVDRYGLVPRDQKLPSELLELEIRQTENRIKQARDSASGQMSQAQDQMEQLKHIQSAQTYALEEAYDSYARGGVYAWEKSKELEKKGKLKKNLNLAMENLFPEAYGAHPEEIISLVKNSRKKMTELMIQKGYNEKQAKEAARKSLSMTFDTGHMNMWRKYWKGDPNKDPADNDKEFDKWALDMTEKMVKAGVVGHVHLDDNYGYQDEHLAPGEGNAPIKEMVRILKENGYDGELIVEPGADFTTDTGGFQSVMKTWRHFDTPIQGTGSSFSRATAQGKRWGSIQYGFFGQNQPPYFTFGAYSPSEDWTLWTGVPLE